MCIDTATLISNDIILMSVILPFVFLFASAPAEALRDTQRFPLSLRDPLSDPIPGEVLTSIVAIVIDKVP